MAGAIRVRGASQLIKDLRELGDKIAKKVLRKALDEGAKQLQASASAMAPVDTGRLSAAISWQRLRARKGSVGASVFVKKGASRDDPSGAYYAPFVEFGHSQATAEGTKIVPARPFIRGAFDANADRIANEITAQINAYIQKANQGNG